MGNPRLSIVTPDLILKKIGFFFAEPDTGGAAIVTIAATNASVTFSVRLEITPRL